MDKSNWDDKKMFDTALKLALESHEEMDLEAVIAAVAETPNFEPSETFRRGLELRKAKGWRQRAARTVRRVAVIFLALAVASVSLLTAARAFHWRIWTNFVEATEQYMPEGFTEIWRSQDADRMNLIYQDKNENYIINEQN